MSTHVLIRSVRMEAEERAQVICYRELLVELSEGERESMKVWMNRVAEEAECAVQSGAVRNAAILVDPLTGCTTPSPLPIFEGLRQNVSLFPHLSASSHMGME